MDIAVGFYLSIAEEEQVKETVDNEHEYEISIAGCQPPDQR